MLSTAVLTLLAVAAAAPTALGATMKEWLATYATTPYSDQHTPAPMTFGTASRLIADRNLSNGTLFVASDDVYQASGASSGGVSFLRNQLIDYTINVGQPDFPVGQYHFEYLVDRDYNISFIWDDYAPGRPLSSGQVWGRERKIYVQTGNEVITNSCYLTHAVFCDDGLIQVTSCLLNPSPNFATALANQKARLQTDFGEYVKIVERAGMLDVLNNIPFNTVTAHVPADPTVATSTALTGVSPADLRKIIAYNIVMGTYASNDHPSEADTALSGAKRPMGPDTMAGTAADIIFYGGIIRGVNQIAVPRGGIDAAATVTGLPSVEALATTTAAAGGAGATATVSKTAPTTTAGKSNGAEVLGWGWRGGAVAVAVGVLGAVVA
ncbi:hypothetical protein HDU67_007384 [Dinochytrium kinnereticum]|nr:hypothetical protein HDU67_007384 [Dinochytrium kinnereticum]